jgi:hypothetical protein
MKPWNTTAALDAAVCEEAIRVVVGGADPAALAAAAVRQARRIEERAVPVRRGVVAIEHEAGAPALRRRAAIRDARRDAVADPARVRAHEVEEAELDAIDGRLELVARARAIEAEEALELVRGAEAGPAEQETPRRAAERQRREPVGQEHAVARHLVDLDHDRLCARNRDRLGAPHERDLDTSDARHTTDHAHVPEIHHVAVRRRRRPRDVAVVAELHRRPTDEAPARDVERAIGRDLVVHPEERRRRERLVRIARDERPAALGVSSVERPVVARARAEVRHPSLERAHALRGVGRQRARCIGAVVRERAPG